MEQLNWCEYVAVLVLRMTPVMVDGLKVIQIHQGTKVTVTFITSNLNRCAYI